MKNKENSGKANLKTKTSSGEPATPQMEKEQPIVNEQEQVYPVNPQDGMFRQDTADDFTSEQEMNRVQQTEDSSTRNQADDYDADDDTAIEETDDTSVKAPKVNS